MRKLKTFKVFFETQWPRIMEVQKKFQHAHTTARDIVFRKKLKKRWADHAEKIDAHRRWMMNRQFGQECQWISTWVDRVGNFKDFPKGNGYRDEILQYVIWYNTDSTDRSTEEHF